jgi:nascent polypeptide-associated complex subunit alpha
MFPGLNKRQMEMAMRKMGLQQQEIDASEVIIRLKDSREIVISQPSVSRINMMGQQTYQVAGRETIRQPSAGPDISEDDVKTVMEQANVSEDAARQAIAKHNGDLAEAILELSR